jgi:hypothetical protein
MAKTTSRSSGVEHPDDNREGHGVRFSLMAQTTSRRSSGVEHFLGREGVMSSILIDGSKYKNEI